MWNQKGKTRSRKIADRTKLVLSVVICLALAVGSSPVWAQDQQSQTQAPQTPAPAPSQTPDTNKPKQEVPPEAGGPSDNVGPYAIPKKTSAEAPPPPPPVTPKKVADLPDYSLKVNVPLVNVDVMVTTKEGQFVPGLKKENFRILEDGVPQTVSKFSL